MFLLRYFWKFMHVVGFENPSSPANMYRRHKVERIIKMDSKTQNDANLWAYSPCKISQERRTSIF